MDGTTLHYVYDPLCGWCYAAAPLVKVARDVMPVRAHGGGLMAGARRRPVTPELREYVLPHDRRIAQMTGQPFGPGYVDGLLRDTSAVFDSAPPIAAVLAADRQAGAGLDMLARLQAAHYVEGRRIADRDVLVALAGDVGLDSVRFAQLLDDAARADVDAHIAATRARMAQWGVAGFPGFVLECDGAFEPVDAASYLGRPQALRDWLETRAGAARRPA
jgi:putative protein-disulfide isomerase